nr:uncharacterized protein LOC127339169 [Lolium perenne]
MARRASPVRPRGAAVARRAPRGQDLRPPPPSRFPVLPRRRPKVRRGPALAEAARGAARPRPSPAPAGAWNARGGVGRDAVGVQELGLRLAPGAHGQLRPRPRAHGQPPAPPAASLARARAACLARPRAWPTRPAAPPPVPARGRRCRCLLARVRAGALARARAWPTRPAAPRSSPSVPALRRGELRPRRRGSRGRRPFPRPCSRRAPPTLMARAAGARARAIDEFVTGSIMQINHGFRLQHAIQTHR